MNWFTIIQADNGFPHLAKRTADTFDDSYRSYAYAFGETARDGTGNRRAAEGERLPYNFGEKGMKTLVVYYSFEGNTEYAAKIIAQKLGADLLQLKAGNEPPSGLGKYLIGGRAALKGEKAILYRINKHPEDYDVVIIGGPVWAGTLPPALREFMIQHPFERKRTALFACSASGNASRMLDRLKTMLAGNEILGELSLKSPLKHKDKCTARIEEFCDGLLGAFSMSEEAAVERAGAAAEDVVKEVENELASIVTAELKKRK